MGKTNTGLVNYAKAQVGNPYWYGTFGQTATESLLTQKMKQYPAQFTGSRPSTARSKHLGKRVHDCCGLIKGYLWSDTTTSTPKYNASQDVNVGGLLQRCKTQGAIKTIPETPGVLVFRGTSHVGVYIGNGSVIEAKGFDYGVIRSELAKGDWDRWGKLDWITYETYESATKEPKPDAGKIEEGDLVTVSGVGAASSSGAGAKTKKFSGQKMCVVKVAKGAAYPYACSTILTATSAAQATGWFTAASVGAASGGSSAPSNPYAAGRKIALKDAPLYTSATTGKVTRKLSGTYYLYDGQAFSGRYRVTPRADMVGKKPVGSNVTGYINKADIK